MKNFNAKEKQGHGGFKSVTLKVMVIFFKKKSG